MKVVHSTRPRRGLRSVSSGSKSSRSTSNRSASDSPAPRQRLPIGSVRRSIEVRTVKRVVVPVAKKVNKNNSKNSIALEYVLADKKNKLPLSAKKKSKSSQLRKKNSKSSTSAKTSSSPLFSSPQPEDHEYAPVLNHSLGVPNERLFRRVNTSFRTIKDQRFQQLSKSKLSRPAGVGKKKKDISKTPRRIGKSSKLSFKFLKGKGSKRSKNCRRESKARGKSSSSNLRRFSQHSNNLSNDSSYLSLKSNKTYFPKLNRRSANIGKTFSFSPKVFRFTDNDDYFRLPLNESAIRIRNPTFDSSTDGAVTMREKAANLLRVSFSDDYFRLPVNESDIRITNQTAKKLSPPQKFFNDVLLEKTELSEEEKKASRGLYAARLYRLRKQKEAANGHSFSSSDSSDSSQCDSVLEDHSLKKSLYLDGKEYRSWLKHNNPDSPKEMDMRGARSRLSSFCSNPSSRSSRSSKRLLNRKPSEKPLLRGFCFGGSTMETSKKDFSANSSLSLTSSSTEKSSQLKEATKPSTDLLSPHTKARQYRFCQDMKNPLLLKTVMPRSFVPSSHSTPSVVRTKAVDCFGRAPISPISSMLTCRSLSPMRTLSPIPRMSPKITLEKEHSLVSIGTARGHKSHRENTSTSSQSNGVSPGLRTATLNTFSSSPINDNSDKK